MSRYRGDQIPFRKMTNSQYAKIEERALENGFDFHEQLVQETIDLRYDYDEIQKLQSRGTL